MASAADALSMPLGARLDELGLAEPDRQAALDAARAALELGRRPVRRRAVR